MSRSRPASNPVSYHKHTKQYYVTRGGKRIYLGTDKEEALKKYHRLGVGCKGRSKIAAGGGLKSRHPRHTYTTTPTMSIAFYSLLQYTHKQLFIHCQQFYHHAVDQAV